MESVHSAFCHGCRRKLYMDFSKGNKFRCLHCGTILDYVEIVEYFGVEKKPFRIPKGYVGYYNKRRRK